jgi:hypothetical protein
MHHCQVRALARRNEHLLVQLYRRAGLGVHGLVLTPSIAACRRSHPRDLGLCWGRHLPCKCSHLRFHKLYIKSSKCEHRRRCPLHWAIAESNLLTSGCVSRGRSRLLHGFSKGPPPPALNASSPLPPIKIALAAAYAPPIPPPAQAFTTSLSRLIGISNPLFLIISK